MSVFRKLSYSNGNADFVSTKQFEHESNESVFCTKDNLEESLHELSEELSSFGIASVTPDKNDDLQSAETLKQLSVKIMNSTWNLIHKHRLLMQLHEETVLSNRKTCNDNVHLKNQVTRLKEDLQKKEQVLCEAQKKENRLQDHLKDVSRDLKHEKEETRKLKKQAQSRDVQHEHEVKRILQINQKLQDHLQKCTGVARRKVSQKAQTDQEKELASYKKTVCRLEENNRQMLEEINNLNETLVLHKDAIDLQMLASGAWTDVNDVATALIKLRDSGGSTLKARALIDSGSEASFITTPSLSRFGILTVKSGLTAFGIVGKYIGAVEGKAVIQVLRDDEKS